MAPIVMKLLLTSVPTVTAFADVDGVLCDHNIARCMHDAKPLTWDYGIAKEAQDWVDKFPADAQGFYHGGSKAGQNQAMSCGGANVDHTAVTQWMSEEFNAPGNNGHYTQVVWKGTKKVGCGMKAAKDPTYGTCGDMVCNYMPPGNWMGEEDKNVAPANSMSREACIKKLQCTPTKSNAGSSSGAKCPDSMEGCQQWCGGAYSAGQRGRIITCDCENGQHCETQDSDL